MAKATIESIVIALMLIVILLLILIACKPWRFFLSPSTSRLRLSLITPQVHDIERPLVSEDLNFVQNQSDDLTGIERTSYPTEGHFSSSQSHGYKQRLPSTDPQLTHSDSFVVDIISDPSEDVLIGQTLKRPSASQHTAEEQKYVKKEDLNYDLKFDQENNFRELPRGNVGSSLSLEVISGPCRGLRCSIQSTNASRLPLTIGRVPPSDLLLKDTEISGKHAMINWNLNKLKWEVVDMGSLNGTLLNSQAINHPDSGSRNWGNPIELASGDIITLGTSTKVFVQITSQADCSIPFGVGLASDPMALRRGAKKLPMEDVCYYRWPLPGAEEFGLFGVCDGHGGVSAATSASKMLPEMVSTILSDSFRRERVLSQRNASDVLRDAFLQTEACMNHYYEGCTATMLLVWTDDHENFFAQCANVGDSACVMNIDEKQIKMTEDHRITSYSERLRIQEIGEPLKDGETRLCGLNLGRMLGDKFLKQQDARFSSEPYISEVVSIHKASRGFALLASDGFWDVINFRRAIQLVQQARDNYATDAEKPAEMIANLLLSEARTLRTKDNTSIIFLDFDSISRNSSSCKVNP